MGGYELMISADIFRGRYRESLDTAKPIAAGQPLLYRFNLPTADHVFLPGHRIMVQIQSSWFPLYDRLIPTSLDAPVKLARLALAGAHVGMLADQHYTRGVEVTFFGRKCLANPLIAMLARQTGLPIYGMRVVRQPDGNWFGAKSPRGRAGLRHRRQIRRQRHDAGDHRRHRRLDAEKPRAMAVAAPPLAVSGPAWSH